MGTESTISETKVPESESLHDRSTIDNRKNSAWWHSIKRFRETISIKEVKVLTYTITLFSIVYYLPVEKERFTNAIFESLTLGKWYAREHVLLCLIPAFFIAGAISVFLSHGAIIKYFGPRAKKWKAYLIASVSGSILAVCSCTVLPLFTSIHKRGAGLGPAIAFLYSGPAINILAIILTANVLGFEMGLARSIGAIVFSIVIGGSMHLFFLKEERQKENKQLNFPDVSEKTPLWKTASHLFVLSAILVFVNWGRPVAEEGIFFWLWTNKWWVTSAFAALMILTLTRVLKIKPVYVLTGAGTVVLTYLLFRNPLITFVAGTITLSVVTFLSPGDPREWLMSTWGFSKQILPLLGLGVLIAGLLLGSAEGEGLIPNEWVSGSVGGNSLLANFFASFFGAFMYFATLTEIPILQGLLNTGMGKGPALALLLAGPSLSLPNMLVIRSALGNKKTLVYVTLVIVMATLSGFIYGMF